jgi:hypothetical protein
MRCVVPTNVPSSEKILKLYDAGRSGGGGITGRPWPGSLHTIRGAPGSLKHVQPALISVLGVKPSAVAAVVIPSETAAAAIQSANLIILFPFRRKMPPDRRRSHIGLRASSCQSARASATLAAALRVHSRTLAHARVLTARLQHQPLGDAITGGCWRISVLARRRFADGARCRWRGSARPLPEAAG